MKDYYTEIRNKLDDGLCEFCLYVREEVDHCPGRGCDGMYCDEAVNNYTMETQDEQDNKKWQYYGLFIMPECRKQIYEYLSYAHSKWHEKFDNIGRVYLEHCTLLHCTQYNLNDVKSVMIKRRLDFLLNNNKIMFEVNVGKIGISEKTMAFQIVDTPVIPHICYNKIPHITIGTFEHGKPVDSNNIENWYDFPKMKVLTELRIVK